MQFARDAGALVLFARCGGARAAVRGARRPGRGASGSPSPMAKQAPSPSVVIAMRNGCHAVLMKPDRRDRDEPRRADRDQRPQPRAAHDGADDREGEGDERRCRHRAARTDLRAVSSGRPRRRSARASAARPEGRGRMLRPEPMLERGVARRNVLPDRDADRGGNLDQRRRRRPGREGDRRAAAGSAAPDSSQRLPRHALDAYAREPGRRVCRGEGSGVLPRGVRSAAAGGLERVDDACHRGAQRPPFGEGGGIRSARSSSGHGAASRARRGARSLTTSTTVGCDGEVGEPGEDLRCGRRPTCLRRLRRRRGCRRGRHAPRGAWRRSSRRCRRLRAARRTSRRAAWRSRRTGSGARRTWSTTVASVTTSRLLMPRAV